MKAIYLIPLYFFFSSCSHKIVRTGYQEVSKADYKPCEVVIQRGAAISDTLAVKIGEIRLGDTGFSTSCNEGHAIQILRSEACALKANIILIKEESRPDLLSSCYRCRAEFYRFKIPEFSNSVQNDSAYKPEKVQNRVTQDRNKNTAMIIGAVIGGLVGGLLVSL